MSDQPIERLARMKENPSRSWTKVVSTARSASPTPRPPWCSSSVDGGGGDAGSVTQKTAARKYRPATTRMTASGPATLTTSGPSSANPTANAALSVRVKIPFAARSCRRGTSTGIIASSAGAKNTVTVETATLSSRMSARFPPAR